jgi:tRNA(Ile2) C34 agmatinyltransferase TiaS
MRTPDQIANLRKVFCMVYGPCIFLYSDETVNLLADRLQDEVDKNGKWTWEIRVITATNFETNWSDIKPEPKTPCCNVFTIKRSCGELLKKYPAIVSILVTAKEDRKMLFEFGSR